MLQVGVLLGAGELGPRLEEAKPGRRLGHSADLALLRGARREWAASASAFHSAIGRLATSDLSVRSSSTSLPIRSRVLVTIVGFFAFDHFLDAYLGGLQKPGAPPAAPTAERSPEGNRTVAEIAYIELNEGRIRQRLKDPETARFRNVRVYYSAAPVVCGEVNARNSFGGAGGYQRFISGGTIQILGEELAPGEMAKTWDRLCR